MKYKFSCDSYLIRYNLPKNEQNAYLSSPYKKSKKEKIIFVPSRISPRKNLEDIIRLAKLLPYNKLVISGGLKDTKYIEYAKKIERLNKCLGSPVILNNNSLSSKEMNNYYHGCFCVLSTSKVEGFGIFALEALNYCKPVVSLDSDGIQEIKNISQYGIYISKDVKDLAGYIRGLDCSQYLILQKKIVEDINLYNENTSFEKQLEEYFFALDQNNSIVK